MKEGRSFHQAMKASEENQESLVFLDLLSAGVSGVAPGLLYVVLRIKPRGILPYKWHPQALRVDSLFLGCQIDSNLISPTPVLRRFSDRIQVPHQ